MNDLSNADLNAILAAADAVISAMAGENEDVHPNNTSKMIALWDELNDRHAPPAVLKALARELLAYREAAGKPMTLPEHMPYLNDETLSNIINQDQEGPVANAARMLALEVKFWHSRPLYAAPQLPAVPYAIPKVADGDRFKYVKDGVRFSVGYANGWNDCRAAMLNHIEDNLEKVNSPVIQDGWTDSDSANSALVMLDRIDTLDSADDARIEEIKRIIRHLAAAPKPE